MKARALFTHAGNGKPAMTGHNASLLAALVLALILLALSALMHAAAAATLGGGWPSLGGSSLAAIAVAGLVIVLARSSAAACRRMCLVNGVASLGLLTAGVVNLSQPDIVPHTGPVFGFAVASGVFAIAGLALAALFFVAWHVLSRRAAEHDHPARS